MYIPKQFLIEDKTEIISFMKQFSFATIITVKDNFQTATHLPFTISEDDDAIVLASHFAKANKQWQQVVENEVLVIFNEPHAYISPRYYDKAQNVPTWNYIAVHAYGKGEIVEDMNESFALLEQMIDSYEADYKKQWEQLPMDFKTNMAKGIVPFRIKVTDLQGKKKLSQNKSEVEQQRIISALSLSENSSEKSIAEYMGQNSIHP